MKVSNLDFVRRTDATSDPPSGPNLPLKLSRQARQDQTGYELRASQAHTTPLLRPPDAAQTPPHAPSDHPLLAGGLSPPPEQSSDHPLLSGRPSGHRRSASSGPLGCHVRSGSSGHTRSDSAGAAPLPPRSGRRWRGGGHPRARSHRRVHSLPLVGAVAEKESEAAAGKVWNGGKSLRDLTTKLEERKQRYGNDHPRVGLSHNAIGNYHFRKGDLSSATKSYDSALECFKAADYLSDSNSSFSSLSSSGSSSTSAFQLRQQIDIAVALGNLGAVLWSTGKLSKAIESLEKGIEIRRHVDALKTKSGVLPTKKDGADMFNALYSLGIARSLRGEYDDAMDALNQAQDSLSLSKSAMPDGGSSFRVEQAHIDDAKGKVHLLRGDTSSAMDYHLHALEAKSSVLGPSHPSVLSTRTNVAAAHRANGQLEEAARVYCEVLSAQKVALYAERDPEVRRRATADIGDTMRVLGEVQREMESNFGATTDLMAAIIEERESGLRVEGGCVRVVEQSTIGGSQD